MFAVVDIAGFQELVKEGDSLRVPLQDVEKEQNISFEKILLTVEGEAMKLGSPYLEGTSVEATVVDHGRHDKIRVVKAHRRKRYRRVHGHRQDYTEVKITKINA
ncbi:50S ribosomal protein L21 [Candidatus Peregrinibacteria bacterium]|nr:50S ribosomal protein L21 [Candidatus Peregrinibacteria bacterium]MBI3816380.1 50S ribosomal protein L21 [Candidatus Peregrinibacteria bacterium]